MVRSCILFTGEGGLFSSGISVPVAGLVDDHAVEFVLHDDGVAGVRPFRLEQRYFGGNPLWRIQDNVG